MGGDYVPSSPMGEMLDEPGVRVGDDDNGERRRQPERETEIGVPLDCGKCFRRTVGRGGKAIRPKSNPGEHRDEGELVKQGRVPDFLGSPEQARPHTMPESLLSVSLFHEISPAGISVTEKYTGREGFNNEQLRSSLLIS